MSTSGNLGGQYGQRQSWRRGETSQAGKRRTAKIILTLVALLLTAWFLYLILRPVAKPRLRTIVVSNSYDIDIVTPPLFGATAAKRLKDQLAAEVLFGDSQQIRSAFGQSELISEPLTDVDDTVMIVLRGYLMLDAQNRPSLACTDLNVRMASERPAVSGNAPGELSDTSELDSKPVVDGLVPIADILKPLATQMPDSFRGVRLLVLDIEPLAAHPTLSQWNETVFANLEQTVRQIESPFADRVWVICTRGPLQNVGWDAQQFIPISTQTLLDGLDGAADLDGDESIELDELCAFMADRYEQLRHSSSTDTPQLMVMRAGKGLVDAQAAVDGDMDLWMAYAPAPEQSEEPEDEAAETDASDAPITNVALQTEENSIANSSDVENAEQDPAAADADPKVNANAASPNAASPSGINEGVAGQQPTSPSLSTPTNDSNVKFSTSPFWDIRDQFESVQRSNEDAGQSVIALAPHLWRQMVLEVLGNEIRNYDPAQASNQVPDQVANDLRLLQGWLSDADAVTQPRIFDDVVTKLIGVASQNRSQREGERLDRRVRTADALQHAIAAGRARLWSWIEYQRQAALGGQPITKPRLVSTILAAERLLASGQGNQTPGQVVMDAQLSDLQTAIELFDRGIEAAVQGLLKDFSLADPSLTWELNRAAWAWLRSPLPTGDQRRRLLTAIEAAPIDDADFDTREIAMSRLRFATARGSTSVDQDLANLRNSIAELNQSPTNQTGQSSDWYATLQSTDGIDFNFADQFAAAIRIDPRWKLTTINQRPITHAITALPLVRRPSVTLLGADQRPLTESDSLRFETMQDVQKLVVNLRPDQPRSTRLLVSYQIRSASNVVRDPPIDVRWNVPGFADAGAGDPVSISLSADEQRDLALEVRPADFAATGENLSIEIQVRGERQADDIKGVTGSYRLPLELPRRNQLRLIASSYGDIGCSKPVTSGEGGLSRGIWLRTFNSRPTPFQLEIFNESGKPCQAKMWLIKLPNPMPQYAGYWPEFAAGKITNPEGGLLDGDGRLLKRFLRQEDVLLGPATMAIPADRKEVPLNFKPPPPAEGTPAPQPVDAKRPNRDVSHAMALVCRLVDPEGNPLPADDQIIFLAAKPWAPRDYVRAKVEFKDGKVEVNAELNQLIDGDQKRDEIPGITRRPVTVTWTPDDQWASFEPETQTEPVGQDIRLTNQSGAVREFIQVEVPSRRNQSWVRLNVDGWPRAIWQTVTHQSGASGREGMQSRVTFSELTLTRRAVGKTIPPPDAFFFPQGEVYYKGGGQRLMAHLHADFAWGANNRNVQPMVQLQVDGRPVANYRTDRSIKTELTELTEDGVITLLTTVSDLEIPVSGGQSPDGRLELTATIVINETESLETITAVLDSRLPDPDAIEIEPRKRGPYFAPGKMSFSISASDPGAEASGIERIIYGLDTTGDGKYDNQRRTKVFDPPVVGTAAVVPANETEFDFAVPQIYGIVVDAVDAAKNISSNREVVEFQKPRPKKMATNPSSAGTPKQSAPVVSKPLYGYVHGQIDTRAGISGTLSISPSPKPMPKGSEKKSILGQDRSFDFGPLPDGEYTLKFKGAINNKSASLTWEGIKPDMTPGRTKRLDLDPADGK